MCYQLSRELVRRGHQVIVCTTDALDVKNRIGKGEERIDGIKVRRFKNLSNALAYRHKLFFSPGMLLAVRNELRGLDIIHMHEYRTLQNIIVHYYAKKYGIPYVLQAHTSVVTYFQKGTLKRVFDRIWGARILKDSSKLIAVSKEEAESLKHIGLDSDKISVIYNGMDMDSFENLPEPGKFKTKYAIEGKLILYLGRIHKTKGIDFAIKAFSGLCNDTDQLTFVIAGADDGYKAELEGLTRELNLSNKVKFTGALNEEDKLSAYVDADLFVHTVRYMGGVGIAPLEAILCNTPVIVTDECGEVIKEANCGYLVKYGDIEGLKEKMKLVIENPEQGKKMAKRGKEYIEENLRWEMVARRVEEVYASCLLPRC